MFKVKEQKLFDELVETKPKLVLKKLDDYPSDKTDLGTEFIETHCGNIKSGIYIAFLKSDIPNNITAKKLFEGLFSENYIEKSLYTGTSENVLERGTAMRGNSMNNGPHGVAKYRNLNPDIKCCDIMLLFIGISGLTGGELKKKYETPFHNSSTERTGKRFIAADLSSVNGVEGTGYSGIMANITSSTDVEELEGYMKAVSARLQVLTFARVVGQEL
jgi:hypothetical protein